VLHLLKTNKGTPCIEKKGTKRKGGGSPKIEKKKRKLTGINTAGAWDPLGKEEQKTVQGRCVGPPKRGKSTKGASAFEKKDAGKKKKKKKRFLRRRGGAGLLRQGNDSGGKGGSKLGEKGGGLGGGVGKKEWGGWGLRGGL